MNVSKWGPGGWVFLHSITFNYPLEPTESDKYNYKLYFDSLKNILPCKYCRQSYDIYIKYIPIDQFLDSRIGVVYWLYRIHNLINDKIYCNNEDFTNVIRKYEDIRAKCGRMAKDGMQDKQYKTCKEKIHTINIDYLNDFLKLSEKYEHIFDKLQEKLYNSHENPNKECLKKKKLNNKIKIFYSI